MVKMSDVARIGQVSVTTVSHVLNETRFVAPETREAVLSAVQETRYVPNTDRPVAGEVEDGHHRARAVSPPTLIHRTSCGCL